MKNLFTCIILLLAGYCSSAQRELIYNMTGYGLDPSQPNGINSDYWSRLTKAASLTYNGQDASVTAVRLHVTWDKYEPTLGNYNGPKLVQAVQTILALKPGMKVGLHFNYQRSGYVNDPYLSTDDVARTYGGDLVQHEISVTNPSIYSATARQRFLAFVGNAMAAISAYYSDIIYVEMGSGSFEEYAIPYLLNGSTGAVYQGFYEQKALDSWRNEYLPCRYPGQSTVVWDGQTHNISSAPPAPNVPWGSWTSDLQKEYHRFASWGLIRHYKAFRDTVKAHSPNTKVMYFISDFGTVQGNIGMMHNASMPMALQEFDGIYTSEGASWNLNRKIMAVDILKSTNPNKIAAIEFDPEDLNIAQTGQPWYISHIVAQEWMERAFKHGVDYIELAMSYSDVDLERVAPALAYIKANYINTNYQPPARGPLVATANIYPTVFTGSDLFSSWFSNNGGNWSVTDNTPISVNMIDSGYWQNIWSCTPSNPCDFNLTASNAVSGSNLNLSSTCSGADCSGVTYAWSGNGASGSSSSTTVTKPTTAGTYTYTITASKSGCTSKTATTTYTVSGGGGSTTCVNYDDECSGNSSEIRSRSISVSGAGTYSFKIHARSHEKPSIGRIRINGGSWTTFNLAQTGVSEYAERSIGSFSLNNGSNTVEFASGDGFICYRDLCVTGGGCTTPAAPSLSASPTTITLGSSSTLSASGCSGGTITWSDGLGTGTSKSVSPTATKTYTATCSIGGCVSSNGSVTVTVNAPSGPNCNTLITGVNGANCMVMEGFVYDQSNPNMTVNVDVYDGSTLVVANAPAGMFRQDLLNAGFGNGNHAFEISTPSSYRDGQSHTFTFKVSGCNTVMSGSPKSMGPCTPDPLMLGESADGDSATNAKPLTVYPNPGRGVFKAGFYLEKGRKAAIVIIDVQGRVIYKQNITGHGVHLENINLNNKASGVLFMQLIRDNGIEVKKINIRGTLLP